MPSDSGYQTWVTIISVFASLITIFYAFRPNIENSKRKVSLYIIAVLISSLSILSNGVGLKEAITIPIISMAPLIMYGIYIWLLKYIKQAAYIMLIVAIGYISYVISTS